MLKDLKQLLILGNHINLRFLARWNIHGSTNISDCTNSFLHRLYCVLLFLKAPLFLKYRPLGNHNGLFLILQVAEDLLCDKWDIRMQQLQGLDQNRL